MVLITKENKHIEDKKVFNIIKYIECDGKVSIQVINKEGVVYINNKTYADCRNEVYISPNGEYGGVDFIGAFNTTETKIKDYADILASYVMLENIISELCCVNNYRKVKCSIKDIQCNKIKLELSLDGIKRTWVINDLNKLKEVITNEIL